MWIIGKHGRAFTWFSDLTGFTSGCDWIGRKASGALFFHVISSIKLATERANQYNNRATVFCREKKRRAAWCIVHVCRELAERRWQLANCKYMPAVHSAILAEFDTYIICYETFSRASRASELSFFVHCRANEAKQQWILIWAHFEWGGNFFGPVN